MWLLSVLLTLPLVTWGSTDWPGRVDRQLASKPGRLGEDDLWHWGNGLYDIARSSFVVGSEFTLVATFKLLAENWIHLCFWTTPEGETWMVLFDGTVTNANGDPLNVEGFFLGGNACGIRFVPDSDIYAGQWAIQDPEHSVTLLVETEDEVSEGLRLPEIFQPIHYNLTLLPGLTWTEMENITSTSPFPGEVTYHKFAGEVYMELKALTTQNRLAFHSDELDLYDLFLKPENHWSPYISPNSTLYDFQRTIVTLQFSENQFLAGSTYIFNILFDADVERGYYFSYGLFHQACRDLEEKQCWFTQFEATNARNAFPCLDEPGLKATFDVTVISKEGWNALSNMPLVAQGCDSELEFCENRFDTTVEMSTYLVAITVTDYQPLRSEEGNVTVWAPAEDVAAGRADYSALMAPKIMRYYADLYQMEYSLPKMDLIYLGHFGSAMENWGLITFDPVALLLSPSNTDPDREFLVFNVVAHELSHQWFGNLVTLQWWDQMWLNEGFATYLSYQATDQLTPHLHAWERMYVDTTQMVMGYDQDTRYSWAMSDPVTTRDDVERKFGTFSYDKGGSVIRMMSGILGEEAFLQGLANYLKSFAYGATIEEDLFTELEAAGLEYGTWPQPEGPKRSFGDAMKTWTDQPGLPVVTAEKVCDADQSCTLTLSQKWLTIEPQSYEQFWDIPLTFSIVADGSHHGWQGVQDWLTVDQPQKEGVTLTGLGPDTPYLVNEDGVGYYRVNYPDSNWKALAEVLRTNKDLIPPLNRAQIICDVANLAFIGLVSAEVEDDVLSYYSLEDDYGASIAYDRCVSSTRKNPVRDILRKI